MNELELHTLRRMEDAPEFFLWQNCAEFEELWNETVIDYYVYLKMIEAEKEFGGN